MEKTKKKVSAFQVIATIICILLAVVLICNVIIIVKGFVDPDRPPSVFGVTTMMVTTGSMEPTIMTGDMIVTTAVDTDSLKVDDIITFIEKSSKTDSGTNTVTHRIVAINDDGSFITKGDNNNTEDQNPVLKENVIGKYAFRIAGLGNVAMFAQKPEGMLVFIGVPIILYVILDMALRSKVNKKKKEEEAKLKEELEALKAQVKEKEEDSSQE